MTILLDIALRGAVIYLYLLVVLRLAGKRTIAEGTPFDMIVAFIISDLPGGIIYGQVPFAQGVVAITTLIVLHILVTLGVTHSGWFDRLITGTPTSLVSEGQLLRHGLEFERINDMELDEALREIKIKSRSQVQHVQLEPSGAITARRTPETEFAKKRDLQK